MKVLVVYAHPNHNSFNHAVLESFTKGLEHGGNTFEVTDLYAIKFNPTLGPKEVADFTGEQMPRDVREQQSKVAQADGLAFIFPIWWLFCPAILKGWIERVFSHGFAYKYTERGMEGLLKHKKALLITTTGGPEVKYKALGRNDTIRKMFRDVLECDCGIAKVEHEFLYAIDGTDDETRKKYLERVYQLGKEF